MNYPIWLALEDFVPVLFGMAGFALLALQAPEPARRAGLIGALLIGLGGLSKCAWKLAVAAGWGNPRLLEELLFPLMAAGAAAVCWALAVTLRPSPPVPWWPFAAVVVVAAFGSAVLLSLQPLFVAATFGVTAISVLAAILAGRRRRYLSVALFSAGLILVMSLVPLRSSESHHTVAYQWLEQSLNTCAQAFLFVAALLIPVREKVGVSHD
ncbi:hypothetical protein [Paractinoplanes atraurantiacus]|uniref:Uncharacterized protein n=1 Tax=Paractinoplanes atraurantiacus TaxID=1036182 RepID=A0A285K2R6_9ACTN|nr:hypothetical protein [Actinoplanes atraurantiacus]SNY66855.1 hypothetical protein SAMN05421748_130139 [Actinoplanes atraurantiacus]